MGEEWRIIDKHLLVEVFKNLPFKRNKGRLGINV
jgi:hypothetical protein